MRGNIGLLHCGGLLLFIILSGCIAIPGMQPTPTPTPEFRITNITDSIILPHSGENVSLSGIESVAPWCCYWTREMHANESERCINYSLEYGGGHGGGEGWSELNYSDQNIAYTFGEHIYSCYAGEWNAGMKDYNCTRGGCNFSVLLDYSWNRTLSNENNCTGGDQPCTSVNIKTVNQTLCFANGTFQDSSLNLTTQTIMYSDHVNETQETGPQALSNGTGCPCAYSYADICNGCGPG